MDDNFWSAVEDLVKASEIKIDRPKGCVHPNHPLAIYPLDYGHLAGTSSRDQSGIDVWIGGRANQEINAIVATIDLDKSDAEIKILIGCSEEDIQKILSFHNQGAQSAILIQRSYTKPTE